MDDSRFLRVHVFQRIENLLDKHFGFFFRDGFVFLEIEI